MKATPTRPPHLRDWSVSITVFEADDTTLARAVLHAASATPLEATGRSVRSDKDSPVPEIGAEVAVARALRRLADQLLETGAGDIEQLTGDHVTLRPV